MDPSLSGLLERRFEQSLMEDPAGFARCFIVVLIMETRDLHCLRIPSDSFGMRQSEGGKQT